ncbi:MAG: alpha/beta fold hydrolase [bacterium]|nr:alpha/beta fold hydrolase [bacterium]
MRELLILWALFAVVLSAAPPPREVSFTTSDNGLIHANLYGDGDHAVVLAHGAVFNKESWDPLALRLSEEGFRVLALDFRGYGSSRAGTEGRALHLDVLAAIDYLKEEGAARVSVLGGSMGGGAAGQAAVESKRGDIERLILLAASPVKHPERLKGRILFLVSEGDGIRAATEQQYKKAPRPKKLIVLDGSAHAQHIFKTEQAGALTTAILDWLKQP